MAQTSERGIFSPFDASSYKVGIVRACFNEDITTRVLEEARKTLATYQVMPENVFVAEVPGCVEIPVLLQTLAKEKRPDALIALGAIIRGETAHFDFVARLVTDGVLRVMLDCGIPIGFGVLTCENVQQAQERISIGSHAVEAALHVARQQRELRV